MASTFDPSAVLAQLTASFMKLPLAQKILFPVMIVGSIWGIVFISQWATRPDYAVLYSDLAPADAGAVIQQLKNQHIKYDVRDGGSTVAISPPELVHELRIGLASEGVPKGGTVGFELFDSTSLGTTSFVEQLKKTRALQGELERSIASLDAVQSVRVHLATPEKSVFAKKGATATASVILKLRPGGELDKKQIKGIQHIVAGSVEGLEAANVSIIDVFGNLLTDQDKNPEEQGGADGDRLLYQREVERGYIQRIEQMLAKVLGPDKVVAKVTAELDFSKNEREEESFDPGGQVARSEKVINEGFDTGVRGGIPGVISNLSNDPALLAAPGGVKDSSNRKESIKNYEVSRAVTRSVASRGKLVKLSVAVLVDGKYNTDTAAVSVEGAEKATPAKVYQPLDADMLAQIEALVKNAVGFDAGRGDSISVENIPFHVNDNDFTEMLDQKQTQDLIFNILAKVGPILFILMFFMFVIRPLVKFLITPTEAELDLTRLLPTGIDELEQELAQERKQASVPTAEPLVDMEQLESLMAENSRLVKENPQQAALLIRYWLNDGRL